MRPLAGRTEIVTTATGAEPRRRLVVIDRQLAGGELRGDGDADRGGRFTVAE